MTDYALSLALKQGLGTTREWPRKFEPPQSLRTDFTAVSTVTGWPIKFQHYASRLPLFVDFLRYE